MDKTTGLLSEYSCGLTFEDLDGETIHQVKRTLIDTLGCAMGGYLSEPAEVRPVKGERPLHVALGVSVAALLFFGVYPTPLIRMAKTAAEVLSVGPVM